MKLRRIALTAALTLFIFGIMMAPTLPGQSLKLPESVKFRLDPERSTFIVHADRAGIAWFKGKSHLIAARDFSGEASLSADVLNPASLEISVKTASLQETGAAFTDQQKGIIKKELDELVLESGKYPEITFRSTRVTGGASAGAFDVKIAGDLTLHGVTKQIFDPGTRFAQWGPD